MVAKPRAVIVPFGYWGYPDEVIDRLQKDSQDMVRSLDIDVTTVSRVSDWDGAKRTAAEIGRHECDFIIVLIISWLDIENMAETLQEHFHKPILLWTHTMFRENNEKLTVGPMAAAGVLRETFEELGLKFKFVWGMPQEKRVQEAINCHASVLATATRLKHSKIGLLGYGSMGMYTAFFDHLSLKRDIGPEIEQLDQYVMIKRIEEMQDQRVKDSLDKVRSEWEIADDVKEADLQASLKMYQSLKDLVREFGWSALTIKCQYELSKIYKHTPCVPLSLLGGEIPCSCEGDIPLITTQLIMHYLSAGRPSTYCDLTDLTEKYIVCAACGFAPFTMGEGKPKVGKKTEAIYEGIANCNTSYQEGQVTVARLAYTRGRTYKMHIAGGMARHAEPFREYGCLPYPSMEIVLDGSMEHFGQHMMSQHYAIMFGDYRKELSEFCRLMGIQEVCS
ncbi:MAG: hypothetical protein QF792_01855 [Phycisphaerae bacterium]|nr:hypothetical protein [Phycisphaerae bacterium]